MVQKDRGGELLTLGDCTKGLKAQPVEVLGQGLTAPKEKGENREHHQKLS